MSEEKIIYYVIISDIQRRMTINTFLGMATITVGQVVSQNGQRPGNGRLMVMVSWTVNNYDCCYPYTFLVVVIKKFQNK